MVFERSGSAGRAFIAMGLAACSLACLLAGCAATGGTAAAPGRIEIDALPNGIAFRPADGSLFVTDDKTDGVLVSHDGRSFAPYATLSAVAGQPVALSEVTLAQDTDTPLVARFGFGTAGAVFDLPRAGVAELWTGLDTHRRRLGLISIGPARALSTWFLKQGGEPATGGLSLLSYDESTHTAVERDLVSGLGKPVGLVVSDGKVLMSDQTANRIVSADLQALLAAPHPLDAATLAVVAQVDGPDLMAVDERGTLYTRCNRSDLCAIARDGSISMLANDLVNLRGVAVDSVHHVLYAVDRAGKEASGASATSSIRTFPIK